MRARMFFIRKSDGIAVRFDTLNPEREVTSVSTLIDLKINVEIPDEKFEFKLPKGLKLDDETGSPGR